MNREIAFERQYQDGAQQDKGRGYFYIDRALGIVHTFEGKDPEAACRRESAGNFFVNIDEITRLQAASREMFASLEKLGVL